MCIKLLLLKLNFFYWWQYWRDTHSIIRMDALKDKFCMTLRGHLSHKTDGWVFMKTWTIDTGGLSQHMRPSMFSNANTETLLILLQRRIYLLQCTLSQKMHLWTELKSNSATNGLHKFWCLEKLQWSRRTLFELLHLTNTVHNSLSLTTDFNIWKENYENGQDYWE